MKMPKNYQCEEVEADSVEIEECCNKMLRKGFILVSTTSSTFEGSVNLIFAEF